MADTGRSLLTIDWDTVGKLLEAQSPTVDIAAELGVSTRTLYTRCKRDLGMSFSALSQQKKAKGRSRLRAAQFKAAMEGNPTMLIWAGKQYLGQTEKLQHSGDSNQPIEHIIRVVRDENRAHDTDADRDAVS